MRWQKNAAEYLYQVTYLPSQRWADMTLTDSAFARQAQRVPAVTNQSAEAGCGQSNFLGNADILWEAWRNYFCLEPNKYEFHRI